MVNKHKIDYVLLDISNLLYRAFYSQKNEDSEIINGMATHIALMSCNKYYKEYRPKRMVMVFDRSSWRKEYTASEQCLSQRPYKGNRRQNMTPSEAAKYKAFQDHLIEFEQLIKAHTTIISLAGDRLEADDLIAGFCQKYTDNSIVVITADSDMAQLLKYDHVNIISPATGKPQTLEKYNNDPLYYLFQKCIRGDSTDNIASAYPRIRSTRIQKAFEDPFEYVNLMNETWTNQNKQEFRVEDVFKENQLLIDLEKQPDDIRQLIYETIEDEMNANKRFSMFHMLKYIGKYELDKIKQSIDTFIPMFSLK